jgi:predicted nucleic acid-binding protein
MSFLLDTKISMIASVALVDDLTVVTNNTKHFRQVPGLRLED